MEWEQMESMEIVEAYENRIAFMVHMKNELAEENKKTLAFGGNDARAKAYKELYDLMGKLIALDARDLADFVLQRQPNP